MRSNETQQEIIQRLQAARLEKGLSYQAIVDGTAALGCPVSLSTVKRVFGQDSGLYDFRYDTTIQPIAAVVLAGADAEEERDVERLEAAVAALEDAVRLRDETIADQRQQLEEKTGEIAKAHAAIQHKTRVEIILAIADGSLAVVLLVFYVAHALMGW
jgi:hypothetical protein